MFAPSDYAFDLPPELIAQHPTRERDASRLLHVGTDGALEDLAFPDVVDRLPPDAILIVNDTRVLPARVLATKPTGGNVELLFLERDDRIAAPPNTEAWRCLARARRPLRAGQVLNVGGAEIAILEGRAAADADAPGSIVVAVPGDALAFLEAHGHVPLPPYIERADDAADRERYQTMFARVPGAVAAPTAGLHMTPAIAETMRARGIELASVTLHVGWGTFQPIRVDDVRQHHMHRELYSIPAATAALVATGRPVVALGTTTLRALESAAVAPHAISEGPGSTELFVYPGSGHQWRVVDHLITNFHLPESTLLMLVAAFANTERVMAAYRHAVAARYRFFSYGDAMLLHRAA